jgi:hypothetical protein
MQSAIISKYRSRPGVSRTKSVNDINNERLLNDKLPESTHRNMTKKGPIVKQTMKYNSNNDDDWSMNIVVVDGNEKVLPHMLLDEHKLYGYLGAGTYGSVLQTVFDSRPAALKIQYNDAARHTTSGTAELVREISLLLDLHHPNIASLYDFRLYRYGMSYMITPLALYDAFDWLNRTQPDIHAITKFTHQVLSAIAYLQEKRIVHGDLKLDNVLVMAAAPDWTFQLNDFGLALLPGDKEFDTGSNVWKNTRSFNYHMYRPDEETFSTAYNVTIQHDLWCLGMMVYTALTNQYYDMQNYYNDVDFKLLARLKSSEHSSALLATKQTMIYCLSKQTTESSTQNQTFLITREHTAKILQTLKNVVLAGREPPMPEAYDRTILQTLENGVLVDHTPPIPEEYDSAILPPLQWTSKKTTSVVRSLDANGRRALHQHLVNVWYALLKHNTEAIKSIFKKDASAKKHNNMLKAYFAEELQIVDPSANLVQEFYTAVRNADFDTVQDMLQHSPRLILINSFYAIRWCSLWGTEEHSTILRLLLADLSLHYTDELQRLATTFDYMIIRWAIIKGRTSTLMVLYEFFEDNDSDTVVYAKEFMKANAPAAYNRYLQTVRTCTECKKRRFSWNADVEGL